MGLYTTTEQSSAPSSPASGSSVLYPKTDGKWYWKTSAGVEYAIVGDGSEITGATLNNCVGKGTWTASGTWTLPALTLGGNVSSSGNPSLNIGTGALTAGATSVTTLTASGTVSSQKEFLTTGFATTNTADSGRFEFVPGVGARILAVGADASTNGTVAITSVRSDGSNAVQAATINASGMNGVIGATTPAAGSFTTLTASGAYGSNPGLTITATGGSSNSIVRLDSSAGNGYGSSIQYKSATTGGTVNQWAVGTGLTGGTNAFEFYDGTATRLSLAIGGGVTVTGALSSTSMITGTALTANGAVAYKSIARATTEDAQIAFYASNGSTLHGLLNGTANSLEWYDSTPTRKFRITSTTMEANSVSTTLTGGNGDQLYLDNTSQRYTQLHFRNNTTAKADIYWDNDTSTFNIRNIAGSAVAVTGALSATGNLTINGGTESFTGSFSGGSAGFLKQNTSNTAGSSAAIGISVGGASASDPLLYWDISGVVAWTAGVDNSDSDTWKLGTGSWDSSPLLSITTGGAVAMAGAASAYTLSVVGSATSGQAAYFDMKNTTATTSAVDIHHEATSGDNAFLKLFTEASATLRGSITYNRGGGVVAYNTTSDYRAKDILGPLENAGSTIDQLQVYLGKMKGAAIARPMLIAHEAQAVVPYAVTGEKDAVNEDGAPIYQSMDHQILVPLLIAEVQSLRSRVALLETEQ